MRYLNLLFQELHFSNVPSVLEVKNVKLGRFNHFVWTFTIFHGCQHPDGTSHDLQFSSSMCSLISLRGSFGHVVMATWVIPSARASGSHLCILIFGSRTSGLIFWVCNHKNSGAREPSLIWEYGQLFSLRALCARMCAYRTNPSHPKFYYHTLVRVYDKHAAYPFIHVSTMMTVLIKFRAGWLKNSIYKFQ